MIRILYAIGSARNRRTLTILLALLGISSAALAAGLVSIALFLDALFGGAAGQTMTFLIWTGVAFAVYAASDWLIEVIAQNVGNEYIQRIHELLANRAVELPLGFFETDRSGQLGVTVSTGAVFAANAPGMMLRPILNGGVSAALASVFLVLVDWRIGVLAAIVSIVTVVAFRILFARARAAEQVKAEHEERTAAQVYEFAQVQPVLRAAGPDSIGERAVREAMREQLLVLQRTQASGHAVLSRLSSIIMLGTVVVHAAATGLLLAGQLAPGMFVGLIVLVFMLAKLATQAVPFGEGLQMAHNTLDEVQKVLDAEALPEPAAPASPEGYGIEFDDVTFGYRPSTPVVRGVSFRVGPGTTTALVGPSGSGKSTLVKLAARFYDVDGGAVRIGGVDVRELGSRHVLDSLAMVFQDVYLFEDTLYENIRLGRLDATRDEVLRAAELAGVTEIAEQLPLGFETVISEGGQSLSGGQRQRVSIARALLKDAPIVLLDEATSSLDIDNEHLILKGLEELAAQRTTIVIAHRLHTIIGADQIVVLSPEGELEAVGTHEELLESSDRYRGFWVEKAEATGWRIAHDSDALDG
ncbi:ABC transporter ATP-binding protein [Gulosibacter sp. 10]|uniref:ABC transporter ATP-binding protein n=1 Tax=Gulosibacter sp. 10 TaxID=1255570 RepID=UPI00097EDEC3|nr:ABC transporter ATP-binding protein [Gulosibacter sp. 10]SJM58116.1 Lipid A export ATP-binding/permease protein MsbA [Gulosibacter sp. 10]